MTRHCGSVPFNRLSHALRRCYPPLSAGCLAAGLVSGTAEGFENIHSTGLDGSNGFVLNGVNDPSDGNAEYRMRTGHSVSGAGDINGDGIDDIVIGTEIFLSPSNIPAVPGRAYVVFGRSNGFNDSPIFLTALNGNNGFIIEGEQEGDLAGISVSGAGDINNDGIDDLIIGAKGANPDPNLDSQFNFAGRVYVIFGRTNENFPSAFQLSSINGSNGFVINGSAQSDNTGNSVSSAGDVNDDGIDDIIIGATLANANGGFSGKSYVVFGRSDGFPAELELASISGVNGLTIKGVEAGDQTGGSVSAAGDFNGDGCDDVIIGARLADPDIERTNAGRAYIIFGCQNFATTSGILELSSLDNTKGLTINGIAGIPENSDPGGDSAGRRVSGAGDFNGDGFDDVIIGAPGANINNVINTGQGYVIFGNSDLVSTLELSDLDGSNGFTMNGFNENEGIGNSVSGIGDINGDGFDDVIIGSRYDSDMNSYATQYVVLGHQEKLASTLDLYGLDGKKGFKIEGVRPVTSSEVSRGAGDVNDDGIDDIIISWPFRNLNGNESGQSFVIFGRQVDLVLAVTDEPDPANANTSINYSFTVTNQEPSKATGVEINIDLSANKDLNSSNGASWECSGGVAVANHCDSIKCKLTVPLAPNATAPVLNLQVTPLSGGMLQLTANATSSDYDPKSSDNIQIENTFVTGEINPSGQECPIFSDHFE